MASSHQKICTCTYNRKSKPGAMNTRSEQLHAAKRAADLEDILNKEITVIPFAEGKGYFTFYKAEDDIRLYGQNHLVERRFYFKNRRKLSSLPVAVINSGCTNPCFLFRAAAPARSLYLLLFSR
ncbi:hypothetical protein [Paranoxybacillus vitaminiphilus]|uniref:hypothetical protein n=1 Tax=Paranoxybacillus vitaminiphilus TaxID=581036 RepID=UPI0011B94628|nr:hypothetical protein [Anoxybacillus vitaminiphilus]